MKMSSSFTFNQMKDQWDQTITFILLSLFSNFHIFHYEKCLHEALYTTPLQIKEFCPINHNIQYLIHAFRYSELI